MTANTEIELREILIDAPSETWVRVPQSVARQLLLNNSSLICGGNVFYFWIRNLGLGICEVCKAPLSARETKMVK